MRWHDLTHKHFKASRPDVGDVYVCSLRITGKIVTATFAPANPDFPYGIRLEGEDQLREVAGASTAQEALQKITEASE